MAEKPKDAPEGRCFAFNCLNCNLENVLKCSQKNLFSKYSFVIWQHLPFFLFSAFISACPGTQSDNAGKTSACAGCPNQKICASGQTKRPDPG